MTMIAILKQKLVTYLLPLLGQFVYLDADLMAQVLNVVIAHNVFWLSSAVSLYHGA